VHPFLFLLTKSSLSGRGVEVRSSMEIATLMPRQPCANGGANGGLAAGRLQLLCCLHAASHRCRCRCSDFSPAHYDSSQSSSSLSRFVLTPIASYRPCLLPPPRLEPTNPRTSHTRPLYISISYSRVGIVVLTQDASSLQCAAEGCYHPVHELYAG
jgi:hypothetical protein